MDQNQGILQALMGGSRPSMPGPANPEIQQSGLGQPQGPLGQLQGMRTQAQQYMHDPNNPIGKMLGQFGQSQMPWGQMPQQAQIPGMLGGQPPMMNQPTGIMPQAGGQPQAPGMGRVAEPMSPYGGAQPKMMG